jgi:type II secretory pathway pseudopilin PulG
MQRSLLKYRVGLGVIGLFTLAILIIVLLQASATKQDQKTFNAANNIAEQLNNYTYNGVAPDSLSQAGINNVPSTISYHKMTAYTYYFCAKYKLASTDFSTSSIAQNIVMRGIGVSAGSNNAPNSPTSLPDLEIDPTHHKGWNCETVDLYNYNTTTPIYNSQ